MFANPWIANTWANPDVHCALGTVHGEVSLYVCILWLTVLLHGDSSSYLIMQNIWHLSQHSAQWAISLSSGHAGGPLAAPPWFLHHSLPWNNYICAFSLPQSLPICWTAIGKQVVIFSELSFLERNLCLCGSMKIYIFLNSTPAWLNSIQGIFQKFYKCNQSESSRLAGTAGNAFIHLSLYAI